VSSAEERRKNQILCVIIVSGQRKISGQLERERDRDNTYFTTQGENSRVILF